MTSLSISTRGDPASPKRIFLLHGLTGTSQIWHHIAQSFASKDYFVIAPDLLGHGYARRGSVYTVAALADELRPLFAADNDHHYDAVIGHSLGGLVIATLLPLIKSTRPIPFILVDPPLELTSQQITHYRALFTDQVRNVETPARYLEQHPEWTKEYATTRSLALGLCDVATVEAIFDHNLPWSFTHLLSSPRENIKVIVLAADPAKVPCVREEDLKNYSHITTSTVWGASHLIPMEFPEVIVQIALQAME